MSPQPSGQPRRPAMTASEVVDIFRSDLRIRVCDDDAAIQAAFQSLEAVKDQDRRSTDPNEAARAEEWFRRVNRVRDAKQRRDLLEIVYEDYLDVARLALTGAINAGLTDVDASLQTQLVEIATGQHFHAEQALAEAWFRRLLADMGLRMGGGALNIRLVVPATLSAFRAEPADNGIRLSWAVPSADCDNVRVVRLRAKGQGEDEVYTGRASEWVDGTPQPGERCRYQAFCLLRGQEGPRSTAESFRLAEVTDLTPTWSERGVRVTWTAAPGAVGYIVVRIPQGGDRRQAVRIPVTGRKTECLDTTAPEGQTYEYEVTADFGGGFVSKGVRASVYVPPTPPPVTELRAGYAEQDGRPVISLSWPAATVSYTVEYHLYRAQGAAAPTRTANATPVYTGVTPSYVDASVETGKRYTYAVFACCQGAFSPRAAVSPPVDVLADVRDLQRSEDDGCVELTWKTPPNVHHVVVRRGEGSFPASIHSGTDVRVLGDRVKDTGLSNGTCYFYKVFCIYRPDGRSEVPSAGAEITGTPSARPQPAGFSSLEAKGAAVVGQIEHPTRVGRPWVVRTSQPPAHAPGSMVTFRTMAELGQAVSISEGRVRDREPDRLAPYYSLYVVADSCGRALMCETRCVLCRPQVQVQGPAKIVWDGVELRWEWPPQCAVVTLARRRDTWPTGPNDPHAFRREVTLKAYQESRNRYLDTGARNNDRATFYYTIYAHATSAQERAWSEGLRVGPVNWVRPMTLTYDMRQLSSAGDILLEWEVEDWYPEFAGICLRASGEGSGVPQTMEEGVELFRAQGPDSFTQGRHTAQVRTQPTQGWARFRAGLVLVDPTQAERTLVIHPDTFETFPRRDKKLRARRAPTAGVHRGSGPPSTIVCPQPECLEAFPLKDLRFRTAEPSSPPVHVKRGLADRVLRRRIRVGHDATGRPYIVPICPKNHELPVGTGDQPCLVIGMVGGLRSGKSTYVASLVHRLSTVAHEYYGLTLRPLGDATTRRYEREFQTPLFRGLSPLPATAGVLPPLMYEIARAGGVQAGEGKRAAALALYDTSGENLESEARAEAMVRYIGVASALLFLIDPVATREGLPDQTYTGSDTRVQQANIVSAVINVLRRHGKLQEGQRLHMPVAMVFTKCDVLADEMPNPSIAPGRLWRTTRRHGHFYDPVVHADLHGMWSELFARLAPDVYGQLDTFPNHAFFGVSATGCAPDPRTGRYPFIAPWRVEEPLLWILWQLGIMPSEPEALR